jgi:YHS domain-containing protein
MFLLATLSILVSRRQNVIVKFGINKTELSEIYNRANDCSFETISYQNARSLILGSIDFAKTINISPHSSWNGIPSSFIEADLAYEKKFSFGQKGKPYYFSGPNDYELFNVKEIVENVSKAEGEYFVHIFD